jgi:hypothetical protein
VESVVQAAMMAELLSQSFVRSVNDEQMHFTAFSDHDLGEWLTSKVIGEVLGVARRPDGWRFIGSLTFEGTEKTFDKRRAAWRHWPNQQIIYCSDI